MPLWTFDASDSTLDFSAGADQATMDGFLASASVGERVELFTTPGLTLLARLFAVNSDAIVATSIAATEQPNTKGAYLFEFDGAPAGLYLVVA